MSFLKAWLAIFDSEFSLIGSNVVARRTIHDSPTASTDSTAKKGDVGTIEDWDGEYFYVDFGKGAIACSKDEIRLKGGAS